MEGEKKDRRQDQPPRSALGTVPPSYTGPQTPQQTLAHITSPPSPLPHAATPLPLLRPPCTPATPALLQVLRQGLTTLTSGPLH